MDNVPKTSKLDNSLAQQYGSQHRETTMASTSKVFVGQFISLTINLFWALSVCSAQPQVQGDRVYTYPKAGQSEQRQARDELE